MTDIRFGIIGLGGISTRFALALKTVGGVKLTAVAARDPVRTQRFARAFGAKHEHSSYLDVIDDPDVDIVYIGLTHNFHYEYAKACLERHKAVLCEKPLVTNYHDAAELVELAQQNQTFLMEGLWTRCLPAFRMAQGWVHSGRIGEVKLITSNFGFKANYDPEGRLFNLKLAGGALFDVGIYPINLAIGIVGEYPTEVIGQAAIAPSGVDEADVISMRFAGGALASLTCGFTSKNASRAYIYGTHGYITLDNPYGPHIAVLHGETGLATSRYIDWVPDGFTHQIRHVRDLYRQGKLESDLIPWKDTLETARIFDALRKQWGLMDL